MCERSDERLSRKTSNSITLKKGTKLLLTVPVNVWSKYASSPVGRSSVVSKSQKGFEVRIPLFQGCAAALDSAKKENLTQSTAALVFYGNGDEGWKHAVDSDLKKSRAYRGDKPPLLQFNYLSGPATAEKQEMIELEEPNVINGLNGFPETALSAFVAATERV